MNNPNYSSAPSSRKRVNERLRRRRRRTLVLTTLLFVLVLLILAALYVGFLVRSRMAGQDDQTTPPDNQTTLSPGDTTTAPDVTEPPETTVPVPETTLPPETEKPPAILPTYNTTIELPRTAVYQGDLILVSASFPYVFPADELHLTGLYGNKSQGYQLGSSQDKLDTDVLREFNRAIDAFYAETQDGNLLVARNCAYRDEATQADIYAKRVASVGEAEAAKYVALPGCSEHHTGMALDLSVYTDGKVYALGDFPVYEWITRNLPLYGFVLRYPQNKIDITGIAYEPWHFRYVGIPHAVYMTQNRLCMEEYINNLRAYPAEGRHLTVEANEIKYEIYYVPVTPEGDMTKILVPDNAPYTVSGNNVDGFIVTVTLG